jgi:hypothetical protein
MAANSRFEMPKFEMPKFEMPKFDIPKFDLPKFDLPKFDLPKFDLPKFDVPGLDLSDVELPSVDHIASCVRDAAYVGIGLAATMVEQLQDLQQQLFGAVKAGAEKVREAV